MAVLLVVGFVFVESQVFPASSTPPSATFDFETGFPILVETHNTPLNQTANGITALFSSPSDSFTPQFSIQSYETTFTKLSLFSGKYLYDNKPSRDILEIKFSQPLNKVEFTFATIEYKMGPSNIQLTAYSESADTPPVGSAISKGTVLNEMYPQGTLEFDSGGGKFNLLRIEVPQQGGTGTTNFFVDNIKVWTGQ